MPIHTLQSIRAFISNYHWYKKRGFCHRASWRMAQNTLQQRIKS